MLTTLAVRMNSPFSAPAFHLQRHLLREVAFRDGPDDACNLSRRLHQVGDKAINGVDHGRPRSPDVPEVRALVDLALFADSAAYAVEFGRHALVEVDDIVQRVVNLAHHARLIEGQADGKITFFDGG